MVGDRSRSSTASTVKATPLARRPRRLLGDDALRRPGLGRRQLDLEPGLQLALLGPDRADLLAGVAGDQALMIRAASSPRSSRRRSPRRRPGRPGGICTAESRASRPPRVLPEDRNADHRQVGLGGGDAGQRGGHPGARR